VVEKKRGMSNPEERKKKNLKIKNKNKKQEEREWRLLDMIDLMNLSR